MQMERSEFEQLVSQALDSIPADVMAEVDNVVVLVEDEPPEGQRLLGLYVGYPLTERTNPWGTIRLPDRITLYQGPLQRRCATREELAAQVRITVVHEIAHHFGISDSRLQELGWG